MKNQIIKLLKISDVSYYRWRKERKIFGLLEKYFTTKDLEEYLKTGSIDKQEIVKDLSMKDLEELKGHKEKDYHKMKKDELFKEHEKLLAFLSIVHGNLEIVVDFIQEKDKKRRNDDDKNLGE